MVSYNIITWVEFCQKLKSSFLRGKNVSTWIRRCFILNQFVNV